MIASMRENRPGCMALLCVHVYVCIQWIVCRNVCLSSMCLCVDVVQMFVNVQVNMVIYMCEYVFVKNVCMEYVQLCMC